MENTEAVVRGITPNRAIFLYHLRVNPGNVRQIRGTLKTSMSTMCAVGLGCDAFNIPMGDAVNSQGAYNALADKLEVPMMAIRQMYRLNDAYGLSFAQVAKVAENYFNSDQSKSVTDIWVNLYAEGKI